jgi:hypothetical protein
MGFGGRSRAPAPAPEPEPEVAPQPEKVDRRAEQEAAALRSRRRSGAQRSLLSPARENAQTGLASKLGGGS